MKVFTEEQRFKSWIIILIIVLAVGTIIPFFIHRDNFFTTSSENSVSLILPAVIAILSIVYIISIKLKTKIDEQGIHYQFFPNQLNEKLIVWDKIEKCDLIKYNSFRKFGGYGYKRNLFGKKSISMNLGSKFGIQLILKNGRKIIIGTQKEPDAKRVIQTYSYKLTLDSQTI